MKKPKCLIAIVSFFVGMYLTGMLCFISSNYTKAKHFQSNDINWTMYSFEWTEDGIKIFENSNEIKTSDHIQFINFWASNKIQYTAFYANAQMTENEIETLYNYGSGS